VTLHQEGCTGHCRRELLVFPHSQAAAQLLPESHAEDKPDPQEVFIDCQGQSCKKVKLFKCLMVLVVQLGSRKPLAGLCECSRTTLTSADKYASLSWTKALIFFSSSHKRPRAYALKCLSPVWFGASKNH